VSGELLGVAASSGEVGREEAAADSWSNRTVPQPVATQQQQRQQPRSWRVAAMALAEVATPEMVTSLSAFAGALTPGAHPGQ